MTTAALSISGSFILCSSVGPELLYRTEETVVDREVGDCAVKW